MRRFMLAVAVSGLALAATSAIGAEVRSGDVIDFFLKSADLGATRGICVGTAQECEQPALPGFDVLVTFELNSSTLTKAAIDNLTEVAKALVDPRLSGAEFAVEGHTDALGSVVYNEELAKRRALSVSSFLVSQGVPDNRLIAIGMGESSPRMPDPYDPANRRVEMRINVQ